MQSLIDERLLFCVQFDLILMQSNLAPHQRMLVAFTSFVFCQQTTKKQSLMDERLFFVFDLIQTQSNLGPHLRLLVAFTERSCLLLFDNYGEITRA